MKKKRMFSAMLIVLIMAINSVPASAAASDFTVEQVAFINFMEDLYVDSFTEYEFISFSGDDITQELKTDTYEYAAESDWESIYRYYKENVKEATKTEYSITRGTDVAKTVTKRGGGVASGVSGGVNPAASKCEISFEVTATLFYDINTFEINQTSSEASIRISDIMIKPGVFRSSSTSVSFQRHSATFYGTVVAQSQHWDPIIYEPITVSLTITIDG